MPVQPVVLVTDALVWLLVAIVAGAALYIRRHEHLRAPWRRVAASAGGMGALTVLAFFVVVGLADSLHFRAGLPDQGGARAWSGEVLSVLDIALGDLRTQKEKTYSAPLATHLFAKETVTRPDGTESREHPRLKYGGAALAEPEAQWAGDVARRVAGGAAAGILAWLAVAGALAALLARRHRMPMREAWRHLRRRRGPVAWWAVLVVLAVMLVGGGITAALAAGYHVLGTDKVGQDVLYLSLKSIRTGLVIGTVTTLVMLPFAVVLGTMAGYFGGWVDDAIQYLYTTLSSIPGVLLIAAAVLMMQVYIENHPELFATVTVRADVRLLFLCVILGVTGWTGLARLLRGEALKLREMEFVQAAHAFGVSHARILARHLVPNVMHIVLIAAVMDFSALVLAEAVLSYVGVGVDPSMVSFGTMINAARLEMARDPMVWWSLAAAFGFMLVLVLAANLFADAVRDAFDPRVRVTGLAGERLERLLGALRGRRGERAA